jgi:hypothetical protein
MITSGRPAQRADHLVGELGENDPVVVLTVPATVPAADRLDYLANRPIEGVPNSCVAKRQATDENGYAVDG